MADTFAIDTEPFIQSPDELDLENPINWDSPLNRGLRYWYRATPELRGVYALDLTNLNRNNPRHGSLLGGMATCPIASPAAGTSWKFDGTDDYINAPFFSPLAMTVCTFVNFFNFTPAYSGVVARGNGATDAYQLFVKSTGKLASFVAATGALRQADGTGAATIVVNRWYRLALTYDAIAGMISYINGRQDVTVTPSGALQSSTSAFAIGQDLVTAGRFMAGMQNDVRIYGRALSPTEIKLESEAAFQGWVNELNYVVPPVFSVGAAAPATTGTPIFRSGILSSPIIGAGGIAA